MFLDDSGDPFRKNYNQIMSFVVLGCADAGKSSIVKALTGADIRTSGWPFLMH